MLSLGNRPKLKGNRVGGEASPLKEERIEKLGRALWGEKEDSGRKKWARDETGDWGGAAGSDPASLQYKHCLVLGGRRGKTSTKVPLRKGGEKRDFERRNSACTLEAYDGAPHRLAKGGCLFEEGLKGVGRRKRGETKARKREKLAPHCANRLDGLILRPNRVTDFHITRKEGTS